MATVRLSFVNSFLEMITIAVSLWIATLEFSPRKRFCVRYNSFVLFFSSTDIKRVLARQKEKPHVLNQAQLSIKIYHEFLESDEGDVPDDSDGLGTSAGGADKTRVSQQSEIKGQTLHIAVDPDVMEFVINSAFGGQLSNFLAAKKCRITWKPNNKYAGIVYQGGDNSDSWQSECIDEVQNYLGKFAKRDVQVDKDSWRAVVAQLSSIRACLGVDPPLVKLIDDLFVTRIVSLSTAVKDYEEKLRSNLEEIHREETRKNYPKKKVSNVPKERLLLFKKIKFAEKLQQKNKELEIKLDTEDEEIYFEGPEAQFTEATTTFLKQMSDMVEKNLALSDIILEFLSSDEGLKKVKSELENNNVEAVFVIDKDHGARVVSTSAAHWDKAERLVNRLTLKEKVQVDDKSESLLKTPEWRELCDEINPENAVRIQRNNWNDIFVAGFQDDVIEVMKKINTFLKDNCIREEQFICSSQIVRRYLSEFRQEELHSIENQLKDFEVKITNGKGDGDFDISGNRKSLTDVRKQLDALVADTVLKQFDVNQPGLRRYFDSGKGDRLVKLVEKDQHCAIQVQMNFGEILVENDADNNGDDFGDGDGDNGDGAAAAAADGGSDGAAATTNSAAAAADVGGVTAATTADAAAADVGGAAADGGGGAAAVDGAAADGATADGDDDDVDDDDVDDDDDEEDDYGGGIGGSADNDNEDPDVDSRTDPFSLVMTEGHHKISWTTGMIEKERVGVEQACLLSS